MRARKERPKPPQCIAWVPRRVRYEEPTEAHRCHWSAHAIESHGVQLCRLHAGVRERKYRPDPRQMILFANGTLLSARQP